MEGVWWSGRWLISTAYPRIIIPGLFPDEYFQFALWSIGHGSFNRGSTAWVVFHHTKTDYLIREASRFAGNDWEIRQAKLPSPSFAGILERLETVSIPLLTTSEGELEDGSTSGFCLPKGRQVVFVTWSSMPPKEWRSLESWHNQTSGIFRSLSYAANPR